MYVMDLDVLVLTANAFGPCKTSPNVQKISATISATMIHRPSEPSLSYTVYTLSKMCPTGGFDSRPAVLLAFIY